MTHTYVSCGRVTIYQRQQIVINKVQLEDGGEGRERKGESEREREKIPLRFLAGSGMFWRPFVKKKKTKRNEEILWNVNIVGDYLIGE